MAVLGGSAGRVVVLLELLRAELRAGRRAPYSQGSIAGASAFGVSAARVVVLVVVLREELRVKGRGPRGSAGRVRG